jgi:hypothetical protein
MAATIAKAWCVSRRQNIVGRLRISLPAAQTVIVSRPSRVDRVLQAHDRRRQADARKKILPIQECVMKALITAFALLSFVAASTVPLATEAQAKTEHQVKSKKKHVHKTMHRKQNTGKRMKKPSQA